jgi:hypothetical protein
MTRAEMDHYGTASEGWRFPTPRPTIKAGTIRIDHGPLIREPVGLRHAIPRSSTNTLCGLGLADLTEFGHLGFFSARPSDRCPSCEQLAPRPVTPKRQTVERPR